MFNFIKSLFKPKVDFGKLIADGAIVVDVRSPAEYRSGHVEGSKNIPLETISQEAVRLKRLNKPIITVCRSGNRSSIARSVLSRAEIEVYNGGSWTSLERLKRKG
jgi:phage shock protein E